MNLVVGFDKPLRQGNTSYPYIIFQFKKNKLQTVDMKLPADQLSQINNELTPSMEGDYYSIFAKLLKLIVGISIIIPGEFKTVGGHPGLKCCVGNQEGILFPLNKSLIFIKKPVILIKIDEIVRVEFHRVSDHSIRSFDFEIVLKNGITTNFSGADKRELQNITSYFDNNKVTVVTVNQNQKLEKDIGEESSDDDKLDINDDEDDDEEDDGDFVAKSDEDGSEEDGDYEGDK